MFFSLMIFRVADGLEPIPAVMVKEAFSKKKPPSEPGSETGEGWETGQKNRPMLPYIKE